MGISCPYCLVYRRNPRKRDQMPQRIAHYRTVEVRDTHQRLMLAADIPRYNVALLEFSQGLPIWSSSLGAPGH